MDMKHWVVRLALSLGIAGGLSGPVAAADSGEIAAAIGEEIGKGLAKGIAHLQQWAKDKAKANAEIAEARKVYWSAYPDGTNVVAKKRRYMSLLEQKDFFYVNQCLVSGPTSGLGLMWAINTMAGGELDGGVRALALPELKEMASKIRESAGLKGDPGTNPPPNQLLLIPSPRATQAIKANAAAIDAYIQARDRAEMLTGLDYIQFGSNREYLATRLFLMAKLNSVEDAGKHLAEFDRVLGAARVDAAATVIRKKPKDSEGRVWGVRQLTKPREIVQQQIRMALDTLSFASDREYLAARMFIEGDFESPDAASRHLQEMEGVLGAGPVNAIAATIRKWPKSGGGFLRETDKLGPYLLKSVDGTSYFMFAKRLLELHVGSADARSYALRVIREDRRVSWTEAAQIFQKYWIEPFGEKAVLAAAEQVRQAPKKPSGNGGELTPEINGNRSTADAMRSLMPSDPYRDWPLGSLTDKDPKRYLYAVLHIYGGVEPWNKVPDASWELEAKWGGRRLYDAVAKLMSARKNDDGKLAAPAELSVASDDPWEALKQLLGPVPASLQESPADELQRRLDQRAQWSKEAQTEAEPPKRAFGSAAPTAEPKLAPRTAAPAARRAVVTPDANIAPEPAPLFPVGSPVRFKIGRDVHEGKVVQHLSDPPGNGWYVVEYQEVRRRGTVTRKQRVRAEALELIEDQSK